MPWWCGHGHVSHTGVSQRVKVKHRSASRNDVINAFGQSVDLSTDKHKLKANNTSYGYTVRTTLMHSNSIRFCRVCFEYGMCEYIFGSCYELNGWWLHVVAQKCHCFALNAGRIEFHELPHWKCLRIDAAYTTRVPLRWPTGNGVCLRLNISFVFLLFFLFISFRMPN